MSMVACFNVSRFRRPQRLLDRRFRQWGHDLESGGVGVKAVIGEIFFQQAFVVDQGGEVVEIEAVGVRGYIVLQPVVELEDFLRRALGKKILRRGV